MAQAWDNAGVRRTREVLRRFAWLHQTIQLGWLGLLWLALWMNINSGPWHLKSMPQTAVHWLHAARAAVIANADDPGYSTAVNAAVVKAMLDGSCTHATIMANMPAFDEACQLVRENGLTERVGIHWVLLEGQLLTDGLKRCGRFCDADGRLCLTRRIRVRHVDGLERDAIRAELAAQLVRRRAQGLDPQHAGSHKHVHEEWAIAAAAIEACRSAGIRWLRRARNMGRSTGPGRAAYRRLLNWRICRVGLARTRYFGSWQDYCYSLTKGQLHSGEAEIMVHPGWAKGGQLVDDTPGQPLAKLQAELMTPE